MKGSVKVYIQTWNKDTAGLYDYDSTEINRQMLQITDNQTIVTNRQDIWCQDSSKKIDSAAGIGLVHESNGKVVLSPNQLELGNFIDMWKVIGHQSRKATSHQIHENDMIRFGKMIYRVKSIVQETSVRVSSPRNRCQITPEKSTRPATEISTSSADIGDNACRVCFSADQTDSNPLICPCNCEGSVKHIHLDCLREWLQTKLQGRERGCAKSYHLKKLECELCKASLPKTAKVNGRPVDLMTVEYPESNYLILENIDGHKEEVKSIIVVDFSSTKNVKVGRARTSDIRIDDITVSRHHASIHVRSDGLFLVDHSSKFGTLVKVKRNMPLSKGKKITVQCGRSVLTFEYKKPWSWQSCFPFCAGKAETAESAILEDPVKELNPAEATQSQSNLTVTMGTTRQI